MKTPAHPHATGVAVYPALFLLLIVLGELRLIAKVEKYVLLSEKLSIDSE